MDEPGLGGTAQSMRDRLGKQIRRTKSFVEPFLENFSRGSNRIVHFLPARINQLFSACVSSRLQLSEVGFHQAQTCLRFLLEGLPSGHEIIVSTFHCVHQDIGPLTGSAPQ